MFCDNHVIITCWLKKKDKKIHVVEPLIFFFFWKRTVQSISKNSLQTPSLDTMSTATLSSIQSMLNYLQNGRSSFIFHKPTCAYEPPYNLLQKFVPLLQAVFTFLFYPYFLAKSSLQSPLRLPSSVPLQLFTSQQTPKIFFPTSTIYPMQTASRYQGARQSWEDQHYFNLSLLPQSMDTDNRAHKH